MQSKHIKHAGIEPTHNPGVPATGPAAGGLFGDLPAASGDLPTESATAGLFGDLADLELAIAKPGCDINEQLEPLSPSKLPKDPTSPVRSVESYLADGGLGLSPQKVLGHRHHLNACRAGCGTRIGACTGRVCRLG